jgi:hypothetical protein
MLQLSDVLNSRHAFGMRSLSAMQLLLLMHNKCTVILVQQQDHCAAGQITIALRVRTH